jgi:hypothetical protein
MRLRYGARALAAVLRGSYHHPACELEPRMTVGSVSPARDGILLRSVSWRPGNVELPKE